MNELVRKQPDGIRALMSNESVKSKFAEILGKNANAYVSSVTTIATTTKVAECEPKSILAAAITAATLNLQVVPSLGFAAIVPYKSKNGVVAQFQIMAKGLLQLALRSGQFQTINVTEVYDGEVKLVDRLTGEIDMTGEKKSDKVVGYVAYFQLLNGFTKSLYMTVEQVNQHAKTFSKTYDFAGSSWKTNFDAMARKTVLKLLLSRYAPLSVEMEKAITRDQTVGKVDENNEVTDFIYVDNEDEETTIPNIPAITGTRRTQEK